MTSLTFQLQFFLMLQSFSELGDEQVGRLLRLPVRAEHADRGRRDRLDARQRKGVRKTRSRQVHSKNGHHERRNGNSRSGKAKRRAEIAQDLRPS